jgi:hypothetical protein
MAERKTKREETIIEIDPEETGFILEPAKVEIGSGYAVSIRYDENEKPIIDVKTYGKVDIGKMRKEIERIFPNAKIRNLAQPQSVTIVKKENKKRKTNKK